MVKKFWFKKLGKGLTLSVTRQLDGKDRKIHDTQIRSTVNLLFVVQVNE